jgi:hypothetical protein
MGLGVCVFVALLCGVLAPMVSARSGIRGPWHPVGAIDSTASGVACPSASLCVAVDQSGAVMTSTRPAAGAGAWTKAQVDGTNRLSGISCPSVSLCVAVDHEGNVVSSADPAGGASTWHVVNVEGTTGFVAVSCPSAGLCVAAAGSDLVVSSDPSGGRSAWTIDANADQGTGPECGKYGGTSGCYAPLAVLSCPTVTFCRAIDGNAAVVSGNPSTQTWNSFGGDGQEIDALACLPNATCLTLCAAGSGLGGFDCGGNEGGYSSAFLCSVPGPSAPAPENCFELSPAGPGGLWCTSGALCFASDGYGSLFDSRDPAGGQPAWTRVYRVAQTVADPIAGVACPDISSCVAVTDYGQLLLGAPPASTAQAKAILRQQLIPAHSRKDVLTLLGRGSYRLPMYIPVRGDLTIAWSARVRRAGRVRSVTVARARAAPTMPATIPMKLSLTLTGKQLLRSTKRIRLTVTARLSQPGVPEIEITRTFAVTY